MVFTRFRKTSHLASKSGPRAPKGGPGEAQEAPRTVQERSGEAQGRPKRAPRATQSGPRGSWERPRTAQGRPWRGREGPGSGPGAAQGTRRRPGGPRKAPRMRKPFVFTCFSRLRAPKVTVWPRLSSEKCSQTEVFEGSTRPNHVIYKAFLTAEARNPPQEAPKRLPETAGTRPEWTRPEETRGGKT